MLKNSVNAIYGFVGQINQTMGRWFVRIHTILFTVLIVNVIVDAFPQMLANQITISSFFQYLLKLVKLWACAGGGLTVLWLIVRGTNLDLWVYYFIFIPILIETPLGELYCRLIFKKEAKRILPRLRDIQASREVHAEGYEMPDGGFRVRYPSFIKREHLDRKRFWPHWVFSIVTIFNEKSLSIVVDERGGEKTWTLAVDLRDESFGIYSIRGKRFLSSRFSSATENYQELSQQTQCRFMPDASLGTLPVIQGASIPMRWASGGFLPVIYYENKYWVSLFFRDIPPIGLNVANGATENKNEYKSLNRLIRREFSEEMILLPAKPCMGTEMTQVMFESILPSADGSTHQEYRASDFVSAHAKLRELHDGFCIFIPEDEEDHIEKRRLFPLDTPFSVTVRYHLADLRRDKINQTEFIVPSINPRENGIETIWLCTFEMKGGEYLIDGEYDLARNYLIRQPVIFLDMDYLKYLYDRKGGLGELVENRWGFDDVKRLPIIPRNHFRLFDMDVEFRKRRLEHLERLITGKDAGHTLKAEYGLSTQKSQDAMTKEMTRIKTWLFDYQEAFEYARNEETLDDQRLRCLCPVTWKTLELIFAHKIEYRKFG